jgi:BlaI family transcriptional regulator, penicillinase repressor
MKELTKAEEQVMQILWKIRKGFVKDIIKEIPAPKPAYNTVSTIVRILEKKGFVSYNAFGKSHEYYPIVAKDQYRSFFLKTFLSNYFGGSFERLVSFFAKDNEMDVQELNEIMKHIQDDIDNPNEEK